jgi:hypothetical protein
MKHKKVFKLFIYLILMLFLFSYIIEKSGYYEYNLQDKKNLTEEEIKQFESDVKNGKDIDINDYLKSNKVDYSNKLTKTASTVSLNLNKYLKKTLNNTFDILGKLIK